MDGQDKVATLNMIVQLIGQFATLLNSLECNMRSRVPLMLIVPLIFPFHVCLFFVFFFSTLPLLGALGIKVYHTSTRLFCAVWIHFCRSICFYYYCYFYYLFKPVFTLFFFVNNNIFHQFKAYAQFFGVFADTYAYFNLHSKTAIANEHK